MGIGLYFFHMKDKMSKIKIIICLSFLFSAVTVTSAFSNEDSKTDEGTNAILEEIRWLQAESIITIATRHGTPINKAPSIVSVITARQIKQMGFRTLTEVLKTIPGYDVSINENGIIQLGVRGWLEISGSPKMRVLIDGHSVNDPWYGGAMNNFFDMVVENIKRIEVIRGPGSALYGRNAFLGAINIVTKDTEDINGFQWTASGGSFDTQNYNMLFGKEIGALKISGFFDYLDTEGFSRKVEQDILFPASFSMSPGRTQNKKEKVDLNLKLSYKNLELKGKYMKKRKEGYIGVDYALNDETELVDVYLFSELAYKLPLGEKLTMVSKVYYDLYHTNSFFEPRPAGFVDQFGRTYPDGFKGLIGFKQTTLGFEDQFDYDVFDGNRLTFGFQYEWSHQHDIRSDEYTFDPTGVISPFGLFGPISVPGDFSHLAPWTRRSATRNVWAFYLQDEWNITDDIDLTVGVRHDHYNRFEGTTNPRIGLVWRFIEDAHVKLLFATAFRAPTFREMFISNQPVLEGNSSLDPEKINTYEVEVGYNFTKNISGRMNYYFSRMRDIITLEPAVSALAKRKWQNTGGARMKGVEAEIRADFGEDNYAYANYTFQDAEETRNRNRLPYVPVHKANLGINVGFWKYVNAHLHTFISGRRPREDGDDRRDLPSYAVANLTLIGKNFVDNFEIRGSVFNLLGKGYNDPSPSGTVPTDFPQPRRSFMVELRYEF